MQGGIFHSCCSLTVTLRVGECNTGAGGEGGPRGIFWLILNLGQNQKQSVYMKMKLKYR